MRLNFKYAMIAVAALTLGLTSCSNDENEASDNASKYLSIKISGVIQPGTRAVEAPGLTATGTIQLTGGHIFVINPLGQVTYNEVLNVSLATGAGQTLATTVAADSRVYIIGNIPSADQAAIAALTTFADIQAATSTMTTQGDYTKAALANSDGQPALITPGADNTATATISIKPLISRLELTQVKGGGDITGFTVTGVYVDSYYPSFTYTGGNSGAEFAQNQSTDFTSTIGDPGTWAAAGSPLVATPTSGDVWAHNVASGGLPRFIIALTNVKYNPDLGAGAGTGEIDLGSDTYYLTVTSYNSGALTAFERGKIYRIGGADGIEFDQDDLGLTPNPVDVDLTLKVVIEEWELVTPTAEL